MNLKVIVRGMPAGKRDIVRGIAKVILDPKEAYREIKKGDILVTSMTDPDFVPIMKIATAIVCDKGGITCHAAIVSRELGVPCIVGTIDGTKKLITGKEYLIDAKAGIVYSEEEEISEPKLEKKKSSLSHMKYKSLRACFHCGSIYPKSEKACPYCFCRNPFPEDKRV